MDVEELNFDSQSGNMDLPIDVDDDELSHVELPPLPAPATPGQDNGQQGSFQSNENVDDGVRVEWKFENAGAGYDFMGRGHNSPVRRSGSANRGGGIRREVTIMVSRKVRSRRGAKRQQHIADHRSPTTFCSSFRSSPRSSLRSSQCA